MTPRSGTNHGLGPAPSASAGCSPSSTDLEERLGHRFQDRDLLKRALTHSSASQTNSNERLEFLGDRVLGLVVAEELYLRYPGEAEGELTKKLHALVRWETCAKAAEAANLWSALSVSDSAADKRGRSRGTILGSACEAVIAALYLDGGIAAAKRFISCYWLDQFSDLNRDLRDAKTRLQQWAQSQPGNPTPIYTSVSREGPEHAPFFVIRVSVESHGSSDGEGWSKREAEQDAARKMLVKVVGE